MAKLKLNLEYLKDCLSYDCDTGIFVWNERPRSHFKYEKLWLDWNKRWSGKEAGWIEKSQSNTTKTSYRKISINGENYKAHRLAWVFITGDWPTGMMDHINGDGLDNSRLNLRDVSNQENTKNQSRRKDNKSGITGVGWQKAIGKWYANGRINDQLQHLGFYDNIFEAACARKSWEISNNFHKNHGRSK